MRSCLRQALAHDWGGIDSILARAFPDEDIVGFVKDLRAQKQLIGEWVACWGNAVVGHIGFAQASVDADAGSYDVPMLTPLSVDPAHHGRGIGSALVRHAHSILDAPYTHFVILGHPAYYPRFGYVHYQHQPIECPWAHRAAFMVRGPRPAPGRLEICDRILQG